MYLVGITFLIIRNGGAFYRSMSTYCTRLLFTVVLEEAKAA